jgi:hypothetical protein
VAETIASPFLLGVDGKDEVNFFDAFLAHLGNSNVHIEDVGGVSKFSERLPALVRRTGFRQVRAIGLIRDADADYTSAYQSISHVLRNVGLVPPSKGETFSNAVPRVGIFVMPDNALPGMLENLCLASAAGHAVMGCVEQFIRCSAEAFAPPPNLPKAKAKAFLAVLPGVPESVGVAAKQGVWDFDSPELATLATFCRALVL